MTATEAAITLPEAVEVLIVGAGPVGAALANLCGRLGIETLLVDRLAEIQTDPRAIALDNEALRVLQNVGLSEESFDKVRIDQVTLRSPRFGLFARMNTARELDTHPMLITFFQPQLERALHAALGQYDNVRCIRPVECLAVSQSDEGCVATLRDASGAEQPVRARFVVAAEGARSPIRHTLGLAFGGSTYEEDWLIVDALNVAQPIDHVDFYCDPRRPSPQMPAPGGRPRWEFMLRKDESAEAVLAADNIRTLLAERGVDDDPAIERKAVYRFHARVAERFRVGRILLAGDAAHVTPPFAGQGLVAGLRDAFNLAWKLKWALDGRSVETVLESYNTERKPHAWEMIRLAQWMGGMIMPTSQLAALFSQGSARLMMLIPPLRKKIVNLENKPQNRFAKGLFAARPARWRSLFGATGSSYERGNHLMQGWLVAGAESSERAASAIEMTGKSSAESSGYSAVATDMDNANVSGVVVRSDDVLGLRLQLLGINVDPMALLSPAQLRTWLSLAGHTAAIAKPDCADALPEAYIDRDDSFPLGPNGEPWLVVVRPDKVVVTDGPVASLTQVLEQARLLLE